MISIVQSLNEPNVFYLWSDTYLIISSLKDFCVYTTLPPPLFSVKFIPFTFSPCEPRLLRKNQLAELIVKEKTDQEATFKQPIFFPTIAFTLVRIAHGCKSPLFIVQS